MTGDASSHSIHLCRFIPTLELHLPYTAHWPRSETGVIPLPHCQVSEHFFYCLGPYSSESEWTESTVLAMVEKIGIRWEKDRLQRLNLEVRSENEVQFLATCADKICYSSAIKKKIKNRVVTHYHSTCRNSRLYHSTLWQAFLVSKLQLDRVLFYLWALSWAQTFARAKAWKLYYSELVVKGLLERVTWDCQWLHLCYPWLPVRRMCPENCLGCMQESI